MKKIVLALLILSTAPAFAEQDDILLLFGEGGKKQDGLVQEKNELAEALRSAAVEANEKLSAEQNIFFGFFNASDYEKALYQWKSAFSETNFEKTATGQAAFAYLLFKNGLEVTGVEHLFRVKDPQNIHAVVKRILKLTIPSEAKVWSLVNVQWNDEWTKVFDVDSQVRVISRTLFKPEEKEKILEVLKQTKLNTAARTWVEWQTALSMIFSDEVDKAAKILAHLLDGSQKLIDKDLIHITVARLLYERGHLDAAIQYYGKVEKGSEYWYTAQEEIAWSYLRKAQPQDSLATIQSVMPVEFTPHVGPESVFLNALAQLKVCDYKGVSAALKEFKSRYMPRSKALLSLSKKSNDPDINLLIEKLKSGKVKLLALGAAANRLPRYVSRDEELYDRVQTLKRLEAEAKTAGLLYARSLTGSSDKVGFQSDFEYIKKAVEERTQVAKVTAVEVIKQRAKEELNEIHGILQKMHVVEAELIQQIGMATRVTQATKDRSDVKLGTNLTAGKFDLVFPDQGEQWFDEIGHAKIDIEKGCVGKGTKSL